MAEMLCVQGFDLCGGFEAIVAVSLLLVWLGFGQNIFSRLLQIFGSSCYFIGGRRNRTLKTKYGKGLGTLQLQLT